MPKSKIITGLKEAVRHARGQGDATHKWFLFETAASSIECCEDCGIVRRRDRMNNPCVGKVKVTLREPE